MCDESATLPRIRAALRRAVIRSGRRWGELSRSLGRTRSFLPRLLTGRCQLRVVDLVHLLWELGLDLPEFFQVLEGEERRLAQPVIVPGDQRARAAAAHLEAVRGELRVLLDEAGYSLDAASLALGRSPGYLSQVLTGRLHLKVSVLLELVDLTQARPSELFKRCEGVVAPVAERYWQGH